MNAPQDPRGPVVAEPGRLARAELVIYDLDGTLLDAFDDIHACVNKAFALAGLAPLTLERVKGAVGDGAATLIRRCLGPEHADRFDEVYPRYMEFYSNNPEPRVRLYPGVLEALAAVRAGGLPQAVLTNKPQVVTEQSCAQLGLAPLLDGVWDGREGAPLKPHPESLLAVARHFGCEPARCVMVGDYRADYEVARATGAMMVGVTWGLFDRERTEREHPDAIIDAMSQLLPLLFPPRS